MLIPGRTGQGAVHEPELEAEAGDALGRDQGMVARLALPIGQPRPFGLLVVAHAATRPRGFTNLCQRIGRSLVSIRLDSDLGPLLAGLPGGRCPCPHWGYLSRGRIIRGTSGQLSL